MRLLSQVFLAGALINLFLNLWLVPLYGYRWAAISTLITYMLLVSFLCIRDRHLIRAFYGHVHKLRNPLLVLVLQVIIFILVDNFEPSMPVRIAIGLIFVLSYGWIVKNSSILWKNNAAK